MRTNLECAQLDDTVKRLEVLQTGDITEEQDLRDRENELAKKQAALDSKQAALVEQLHKLGTARLPSTMDNALTIHPSQGAAGSTPISHTPQTFTSNTSMEHLAVSTPSLASSGPRAGTTSFRRQSHLKSTSAI